MWGTADVVTGAQSPSPAPRQLLPQLPLPSWHTEDSHVLPVWLGLRGGATSGMWGAPGTTDQGWWGLGVFELGLVGHPAGTAASEAMRCPLPGHFLLKRSLMPLKTLPPRRTCFSEAGGGLTWRWLRALWPDLGAQGPVPAGPLAAGGFGGQCLFPSETPAWDPLLPVVLGMLTRGYDPSSLTGD